jgi:hypothetical protein
MWKKYDIVKEATALVENHLCLLQALYLARQTQAEGTSRLICRCGNCQTNRAVTLDWLKALLVQDEPQQSRTSRYHTIAPAGGKAPLASD